MNPKEYCQKHGMSTAQFIKLAREVAPKYQKAAHCMASNPDYGVTLRSAVVRHIQGTTEHRRNPCRIQFRVTEAQKQRLTELQSILDLPSMQDVMVFIVRYFLDQMDKERAAVLSGTEGNGNGKTG